jgi:hypothetical protein
MVSVKGATLAALTLPSRHPAVEAHPEVTSLNLAAETAVETAVETTTETATSLAVIRLSPAVSFPPSSLDLVTVSAVVTVPSLPLPRVLAWVAVTTPPMSLRLPFRPQEPVAAAEASLEVLSQPSLLAPAKASVVAMARTEASRSELDPLSKRIHVE